MKQLVATILAAGLALATLLGAAAGPAAPAVIYSTFLGSDADEQGRSVAIDQAGRAYVTGYTSSTTFPGTDAGRTPNHGVDVYAVRFDPTGSSTEYLYWFNALTLFAEDEGFSVAVDGQGAAYVTGYTRSEDFCTVFGAVPGYHPTYFGETDAFVLKIKPDGSGLAYCTFLGGSDWDSGRAIAVDSAGNAYVVGGTWSTDFPTTADAVQSSLAGLRDIFLARLNADGTALEYSTLLGGSGQEEGAALTLLPPARSGGASVVLAGWTNSGDFPTTAGVLGPTYGGNTDGFLARLTVGVPSLSFASYLGGTQDDRITGLDVRGSAGVVVAGYTESPDFPTTPGAFATSLAGRIDSFASLVAADGSSLVWSTTLGGQGNDQAWDLAPGAGNTTLLVGETTSSDFPTTPSALDPTLAGSSDAFVARLSPNGDALEYGSFLGGSGSERAYGVAAGQATDVVVTGLTQSPDFPTTPQAYDTEYNGSGDIFVTKLSLDAAPAARPRSWLPLVRRGAH